MKKPIYENKTPIDINATYVCPMIRKDSCWPNEIDELTMIKIEPYEYGGMYKLIPLDQDTYNIKYFYDKYMDWLFHTAYIRKLEK